MPGCTAYVDESFREHDAAGFYVLAAAVFDDADTSRARQAMLELRGSRRTEKLHWSEMDRNDQLRATEVVRLLDGVHLVTVGSPVHRRGQERARRISLRRMVFELHALGVEQIYMEARQDKLDQRDVQLVRNARFDLPKGTQLRVDHERGASEPLFWIADIVAGAVRASHQGRTVYRDQLGDQVEIIAVAC